MSKPPTQARGRRALVAPPPAAPPRRSAWARAERASFSHRPARLPVRFPPLRGLGWRPLTIFVLAIAGLCDSVYLTLTHYTSIVPLVCKSTGAIDCAEVTSSPQSIIFGIPVAVYGLAFFVAMVAMTLPPVWRRQTPLISATRLGASTVGVGFVAYLLYTELYVIGKICIWCTAVHVVTFLIFVLLVTGWEQLGELGMADRPESGGLTDEDFDFADAGSEN